MVQKIQLWWQRHPRTTNYTFGFWLHRAWGQHMLENFRCKYVYFHIYCCFCRKIIASPLAFRAASASFQFTAASLRHHLWIKWQIAMIKRFVIWFVGKKVKKKTKTHVIYQLVVSWHFSSFIFPTKWSSSSSELKTSVLLLLMCTPFIEIVNSRSGKDKC